MKTLMVLVLLVGGCVGAEDHPDDFVVSRGSVPPSDSETTSTGGASGGAGGAGGSIGTWVPPSGAGGAVEAPSGAGGAMVTGAGGATVTGAGGAMVTGAGGSGVDPVLLNISCVSTRGCAGNQVCYDGKCSNTGNGQVWTSVTCEQSGDCQYGEPGISHDVFTCGNSAICDASKHCACAP